MCWFFNKLLNVRRMCGFNLLFMIFCVALSVFYLRLMLFFCLQSSLRCLGLLFQIGSLHSCDLGACVSQLILTLLKLCLFFWTDLNRNAVLGCTGGALKVSLAESHWRWLGNDFVCDVSLS